MNNLNIPPDRESWQAKLSRLATELMFPVLLPASTAFVVWIGIRKSARLAEASCDKDTKEKEEVREVKTGECTPQCKHKPQATYLKKRCDFEQIVSEQEEREFQTILRDLSGVKSVLRQRQHIYCSSFRTKETRKELEKWLLDFAYQRHYDKELSFYLGMQKVIDEQTGDTYCGRNIDENGCLMWEWLEGMKAKARLRKYQRIYYRVKAWDSQNKPQQSN